MAKQPLKKKEVGTKTSISDFKSKLGLFSATQKNTESGNADKKLDWYVMPHGYQEALKIPGLPRGYVTTIVGHSNVGKSTLVNHAIVSAQKKGDIPVIYDTENNFDFSYAINMGFEATPVYGDVEIENINPETGEVTITTENRIIGYDGDFIYFNNAILAQKFGNIDYSAGKETKTYRKTAVIEDIAASMKELLDAQDEGMIDRGFLFVWDSVGSIGSYKSFKSPVGNNMFDAGAISQSFQGIVNDRIPRSRKVSSPYTNTMLLVNKVWLDSMTAPMAQPSLSLKGGNSMYYASRLIILLGGTLKASTKKLVASSKGVNYNYGIDTKIKVIKNQLPAPYTVTYEGNVLCTAHGMLAPDEADAYKKNYIGDILKELSQIANGEIEFNAEDVTFSSEETEDA